MKITKKFSGFLDIVITPKTLLIIFMIFLVILIIPILYIAKWNVPSADDYSYAVGVHNTFLNNGTLIEIIKESIKQVKNTYYDWSGLMSSVFLWTLMPASFGEENYIMVAYMMLFSLITGVCFFTIEFFTLFSKNRSYGLIIAITILIGCTQFLPSPVQAFFWYAGSVCYTFSFGISLIYYALLIRWLKNKSNTFIIFPLIFLSFFTASSNFITALCTAILLVSLLVLLIIQKKDSWKKLLFLIIVYGITFYFVVSAPENNGRKSTALRLSVVQTILDSFQFAIHQIFTLNKLSVIALYILLLPILWKIASESAYSFQYPWLVTVYSFCLQASMNSPTIFTDIEKAPGRVENIRYFAMLILFVINIFYWFGWLSKGKFRQIGDRFLQMKVYHLILSSALFIYGLTKIPVYRITTPSAIHSYKVGWVGQYKHVYNQRIEILENPEIQDAVLREYPNNKPFVLYFSDIS